MSDKAGRYAGVLNYPAWRIAEMIKGQRAAGGARTVSAQMYYSLVGRDIEHEFVPIGIGQRLQGPVRT